MINPLLVNDDIPMIYREVDECDVVSTLILDPVSERQRGVRSLQTDQGRAGFLPARRLRRTDFGAARTHRAVHSENGAGDEITGRDSCKEAIITDAPSFQLHNWS
jgi:hypothetical protein